MFKIQKCYLKIIRHNYFVVINEELISNKLLLLVQKMNENQDIDKKRILEINKTY